MGGGRALFNQGYGLQKILPDSVTKGYKVKNLDKMYATLLALFMADLLSAYAMYVLMNYLTNVWNLSITHAAGIINIFDGITSGLVIVFAFFVDAFLGDFYMLVLSTIAYSIGLGLLSLSTPPFFGPCSHYKEECIDHKQKVLFFTALSLIAIGIAGLVVSLQSFQEQQNEAQAEAQEAKDRAETAAVVEVEAPTVAPIVAQAISWLTFLGIYLELVAIILVGVAMSFVYAFVYEFVPAFVTAFVAAFVAEVQKAKAQAQAAAPTAAEVKTAAPTVPEAEIPIVAEAQSQSQADQEEVGVAGPFIYIMAFGIMLGMAAVILVGVAITFMYVKPWSIQFGVPAICAMIATVVFLSGYPVYYRSKPKGSPLTIGLRVFVAAASKEFQQVKGFKAIYNDDYTLSTKSLRWLEKAATKFPDQPMSKSWTLCTIREVEDTKTVVRMIPLLLTFIGTGLVLSIGNTYFIEQANHMDRRLGKINIPIPFFKLFDTPLQAESFMTGFLGERGRKFAQTSIATGMVSSVLCCIISAAVENKRLDVIRKHGLLDKPNERIPMTVFYLLPQFLLLGVVRAYVNGGLEGYLRDTVPQSMQKYLLYFQKFVLGLGSMASVLLVYVVGKLSEINNNPNWFQHTSNKSRLDLYYWTLAGVSVLPLICFIVASSYKQHNHEQEEEHVDHEQEEEHVDHDEQEEEHVDLEQEEEHVDG